MSMTPLTIENPVYFDRLAEVERRHWWALGMWRLAAEWLRHATQGRRGLFALDLGCGTGETALRLARLEEVDRVIGMDPSPEALAHSRSRHGFPLLRGSATAIPLADESLDVLTCFDVFQHLPRGGDRVAAAEIARVLAPGGVALIRANGRGFATKSDAYRLIDLTEVLRAGGLRVRRASYVNCLPSVAQEVRGRLPKFGPSRGMRSDPGGGGLRIALPAPWINRVMSGVSTAEALAVGRFGIGLPFGHGTMALVDRPEIGEG